MRLLIATTNPGKLAEFRKYLSDFPVKLVSLQDLGIKQVVSEPGKTFKENALLKARFYSQLSGLPTLADDGGFEVDALSGEPGVKSHRWIDPQKEASDKELVAYTIKKMRKIPKKARGAQLRLVMALVFSRSKEFTTTTKVRGIVAIRPLKYITPGFPYRSLLFLPKLNKFYNESELTPEESARYNHRRKAINKIKKFIISNS